MNILNLLTKEKHVAGIEISDSVVRIAFFRPQKKSGDAQPANSEDELVLIEEPIAANIIADGIVADTDLLGKTLRTIWAKAHLGTNYAIVAIPDDAVYSRIFSFPKTVEGARLTEAMRLAISFQLPIQTDNAYLDWERTKGTPSTNEILLSTVSRTVVQGYVAALDAAGIKTLALESHLASIARSVKLEPERTTIFSKETPDGATVFALKDGIMRFSRTLPIRFVPESNIPAEVARIKTAFQAETKERVDEKELAVAEIREEYRAYTALTEPKSKWLVALGAAIRGKIPEGDDNLVSLLPVGTEEAYAYQKATTFAVLVRNITIGVSVFFVAAFLSAYLFVISLSQNANRTITTLSATPVSPVLLEKEARIEHINALTNTASAILAETPAWNAVLAELMSRTIDGIVISSFSASSIADKMSIAGIAKNRATLNQFKKSMQDSAMLTEVDVPTTNLEQRETLPFSVSFRFKDSRALYYGETKN
ncbi:MAG: pilus assembly protein PilM [Candidatus Yonathbacteria bacterium]|nr:pilus assembly protein PilM [Candidatus Yonathbacteria bacterium]